MSNYDDIINLKRPLSKYPKLSDEKRAALFMPFNALTGYDDKIKEAQRLTNKKIEIDDELRNILNEKIYYISKHIKENNEISFVYFKKDDKKDGGEYKVVKGIPKNIDQTLKLIKLKDNSIIYMDDIIDIKADVFNELYE